MSNDSVALFRKIHAVLSLQVLYLVGRDIYSYHTSVKHVPPQVV